MRSYTKYDKLGAVRQAEIYRTRLGEEESAYGAFEEARRFDPAKSLIGRPRTE
ncbi:MAG: hypothetical protein H0T46_05065 [Deltaproteobacteria bacterium]|nr:hypothetical protein [Deltaproteobacteria bacterium]